MQILIGMNVLREEAEEGFESGEITCKYRIMLADLKNPRGKFYLTVSADKPFVKYALCEIIFPDQKTDPPIIDSSKVYVAIKNALLDAHGDFGLGALQFSLSVKYLNIKTNIAIIRGARKYFDILSSSIFFIRKIGPHNVIIKTLHVGGSIRACQKFLIRYHHRNMTQIYPQCRTEEQRAKVMKAIMEICDELEIPFSKLKPKTQETPSALNTLQSVAVDS